MFCTPCAEAEGHKCKACCGNEWYCGNCEHLCENCKEEEKAEISAQRVKRQNRKSTKRPKGVLPLETYFPPLKKIKTK
jgi:hypothetical protein